MSSVRVCAINVYLVCMWDAWLMYEQDTHGAKCVNYTTNDQNMISMNNFGDPQNLVLIGVQNNEKMKLKHKTKNIFKKYATMHKEQMTC